MSVHHLHGAFSWADLAVDDPATVVSFYTSLFGWETVDQHDADGNLTYSMCFRDKDRAAGIGNRPAFLAELPPLWNAYINVDDLDAVFSAATAHGGRPFMEPTDISDMGRLAYIGDPSGACVGLWQAGTHPGADSFAGGNVPSWFELTTRDPDAAIKFFTTILPWDIQKMPVDGFDYWTISNGHASSEPMGGILAMDSSWPDDLPAHWMIYFRVADTDATAAKLVDLGGVISVPAFDTDQGRLAVVNDPQGFTFSIISGA